MKGLNIAGMKETLLGVEESTFGDVLKYGNKRIIAIVMETLNSEKAEALKQNIKNSKISRKEGKKLFKEFLYRYEQNRDKEELVEDF
jgi:hypothetical protein